VRKDRVEPSHALALGVQGDMVRRIAGFTAGDPAGLAYLRGETLASASDDGWTLVTVDGFPLGWAKRVGGRLKSHYPKGLRLSGA
jgi:NOL1/NOP2/fmu family ribosome biogenesis protein